MSDAAVRERAVKRHWAEPGSRHDGVIRSARVLLPAAAGVLFAFLVMSPLRDDGEVSFILDKKEVERSQERMRVESARYTGQDDKGQQFVVQADRALQRTSDVPIVDISGMRARLDLESGPAVLTAPRGRYDLETQRVTIPDQIRVVGPDGYRLSTQRAIVDLRGRMVQSNGGATGAMRRGQFSARGLTADIAEQRVVLDGGVRLKIVQGAVR